MTEAIWKGRPLIGGAVGGIPLQVSDGETGFLVSSVEECAQRSLEILADPGLATTRTRRQGGGAKQFLMPRLLRDWLDLFERLEV